MNKISEIISKNTGSITYIIGLSLLCFSGDVSHPQVLFGAGIMVLGFFRGISGKF